MKVTMKEKMKSYILLLAGSAMTGAAISLFFVPNKIVNGGTSGLATVIFYTLGIKPSLSNAGLNIILLLLGLRYFGWDFVIKTMASVGIMTIWIEVFSYFPSVTDNMLLAAIFGAALQGLGIGIILSQGSTTGGTDILGRLIQYKFPHWKIGKIVLGVDLFVLFLSFCVFKTTEAVLYGIITLFISSVAVDYFIKYLNISKIAFVITDKGAEISSLLVKTSSRGVTVVDVTGAYSNRPKQMLICALKENELPKFQSKIFEKDEKAFVIYSESQQIIGEGFCAYR